MLTALATLTGCALAGEVIRALSGLPLPGPVIGMFLLAAALVVRAGGREPAAALPSPLSRTAGVLLGHMGLLFVPAGAGIIAQAGVIGRQWLPITVAVTGSTVLSLLVTALVMQAVLHRRDRPAAPMTTPAMAEPAAATEGT